MTCTSSTDRQTHTHTHLVISPPSMNLYFFALGTWSAVRLIIALVPLALPRVYSSCHFLHVCGQQYLPPIRLDLPYGDKSVVAQATMPASVAKAVLFFFLMSLALQRVDLNG